MNECRMSGLAVRQDTLVAIKGIAGFRSGISGIERNMSIKSFEDLERVLLKGSGLAASSYKVYLSDIRIFYRWRRSMTTPAGRSRRRRRSTGSPG
jgi:hypothetical protein